MILLHRIGPPRIGPAAAATIAAALIILGRDVALQAGAGITRIKPAARHRGHSAHRDHGDRRRHSCNRLTHYTLLWICFLLAFQRGTLPGFRWKSCGMPPFCGAMISGGG